MRHFYVWQTLQIVTHLFVMKFQLNSEHRSLHACRLPKAYRPRSLGRQNVSSTLVWMVAGVWQMEGGSVVGLGATAAEPATPAPPASRTSTNAWNSPAKTGEIVWTRWVLPLVHNKRAKCAPNYYRSHSQPILQAFLGGVPEMETQEKTQTQGKNSISGIF